MALNVSHHFFFIGKCVSLQDIDSESISVRDFNFNWWFFNLFSAQQRSQYQPEEKRWYQLI